MSESIGCGHIWGINGDVLCKGSRRASSSAYIQKALAGAESNVAVGLARLGFRVGWMSKVGADSLGTFILEELQKEGVDTSAVLRSNDGSQTGILLKSKVMDGDPDVTYYRKGSAASTMSPSDFPAAYFKQAGHLHMTGIPPALSSGMRAFSFRVLQEMKEAGKTISFDPNLRLQLWEEEEDMVHTVNHIASQVDWFFFQGLQKGKGSRGVTSQKRLQMFICKRCQASGH
ncbi:hypothetical protein BsIDN1_63410 [Bacillus safensis]|uniref:Carbohydrate kinase PfkB domain-containing protein n=1 Tax=Bacillus safensis TaxID=561879 RepID=A0A5S9MHZ0_BACIA|nr:hypothetical protein BsIDN1_63410 [Bacillus safensis]